MVAEVLSGCTELTDRLEKRAAYQKLQRMREYVLLAQDRAYIKVYQRVNLRHWGMTVPGLEDTLVSSCGDTSVPVRDFFRGVDFSTAAQFNFYLISALARALHAQQCRQPV